MKRVRIINIMLASALVLSLIPGCKEKKEPSPSPLFTESSEKSSEPVTVVDIFQYKAELKDLFKEAAKEYNEKSKDVVISIETVNNEQDYNAALRARFNSGNEPALFNIGGPQDIADWGNTLADLKDSDVAKNVMQGLVQNVYVDGKVCGLPFSVEGYGLIYNKKILEKAEIELKSINSYKTLEDAVKKLDKEKERIGIDAVFAFAAKETPLTGVYLSNVFISPEFEGNVFKAYRSKSIEFKYESSFKQLVDLQNNYSIQPSANIDYDTQVVKLFCEGKVAMIMQGTWAYKDIEAANKELAKENIGMLPLPISGAEEDFNPVGVPMFWAVNATKQEDVQKAAVGFLSWLYISDDGKEFITDKFKLIPAYMGFEADAIKDQLSKDVLSQLGEGKTINWVFSGYPDDWGAERLGADIQRYAQKELSWDQVIKNAKASWADKRK